MEIFSNFLFMFLSVLGGAPPVLKTSTTRKNSGSLLSWTLVKGHAVLVPCLSVLVYALKAITYVSLDFVSCVKGLIPVWKGRTDSRVEGKKDRFPCEGKETRVKGRRRVTEFQSGIFSRDIHICAD